MGEGDCSHGGGWTRVMEGRDQSHGRRETRAKGIWGLHPWGRGLEPWKGNYSHGEGD